MLKSLATIEKVAGKIAPGRAPYFVEAHIVKALAIIDAQAPVGRIRLAKSLGLGEGAARTLVKHLEKERLAVTSRQGMALTDSGRRLISDLKQRISTSIEVQKSPLTVGAFNVAILVKNASRAVRAGLEQRDAAIRVGAQGATTFVFTRRELTMPSTMENVFESSPDIRKELVSQLSPYENDVIVIGSADDKLAAEYGAIAAALETLKALQGK
jgi:predicted transcriptional regulator